MGILDRVVHRFAFGGGEDPKKAALAKGWTVLIKTASVLNQFGPHLYSIRQHVSDHDYEEIRQEVTEIGDRIAQLQQKLERLGNLG